MTDYFEKKIIILQQTQASNMCKQFSLSNIINKQQPCGWTKLEQCHIGKAVWKLCHTQDGQVICNIKRSGWVCSELRAESVFNNQAQPSVSSSTLTWKQHCFLWPNSLAGGWETWWSQKAVRHLKKKNQIGRLMYVTNELIFGVLQHGVTSADAIEKLPQ